MDFKPVWPDGPVFAQGGGFRPGTDSMLLADFARSAPSGRGIDLGCGSGLIMLLLAVGNPRLEMTGLEINPQAAHLARENLAANGLDGRCSVIEGDIREHRALFRTGRFDLVVSNPPYFPAGSGGVSPNEDRAAARGELLCSLEDICRAAAFLCRTGGSFCLVHRAERLADALCLLRETGLEPKRLRMVAHSALHAPSLALIDARRGARPGLKALPQLNLNGAGSEDVSRIFHTEGRS